MSSTSSHIPNHQNNINNIVGTMNISCNNNTTFVQADPSNFRSVVQKLTGNESEELLNVENGHQAWSSSTFKLHERRHSTRKLESIFTGKTTILSTRQRISSSSSFLASPVSPLEMLTRGISPRSTMEEDEEEEEEEEEEERAIAEKRFYLHPSTPRASQPPQLLPLFPLQSPTPPTATHH